MKTTLIFLRDFYYPQSKKTFIASDPKNNFLEIDVDEAGTPTDSFWFIQIKDDENKEYFQLQNQITTTDKPKKAK